MATKKRKKKRRIVGKVFFFIGIAFFAVAGSLVATAQYKLNGTLGLLNKGASDLDDVDLSGVDLTIDKDVVNILLVGVDSSKARQKNNIEVNNTDTMMIATMDMKHNEIKVTSLMRDLYVPIAEPMNASNKLNSAYCTSGENGGIKCLYKTIANNFGVKMDGYVIVDLDAFTAVVNEINGVELDLTESEAYHLNNTNYIKKKKYRNLKPGVQVLNGWQAMGYCQIRHGKRNYDGTYPAVVSQSGAMDDYSRTERQRLFMTALFKKVKSMSLSKWMDLVKVVLPNVTTDINNDEIYSYMMNMISMGTTDVKQFRLPVDGLYSGQVINGQDQLVPDIPANRQALKKFLYDS